MGLGVTVGIFSDLLENDERMSCHRVDTFTEMLLK